MGRSRLLATMVVKMFLFSLMVSSIIQARTASLEQIQFNLHDANKDGIVSEQELIDQYTATFKLASFTCSTAEHFVPMLIEENDLDKDGGLNFQEFMNANENSNSSADDNCQWSFRWRDSDKNGVISREEYTKADMDVYGQVALALFDAVDENKDGQIDMQECWEFGHERLMT